MTRAIPMVCHYPHAMFISTIHHLPVLIHKTEHVHQDVCQCHSSKPLQCSGIMGPTTSTVSNSPQMRTTVLKDLTEPDRALPVFQIWIPSLSVVLEERAI